MLHAAYIDNGIEGLEQSFRNHERVRYTPLPVTASFAPDLMPFDLLIVPNGSDHRAMSKIRDRVRDFLGRGRAVFCFDGWTSEWVPGNRWVFDCDKPTREVRYAIRRDRYDLFRGVALDELIFHHGISGWWACGYIEPAARADVVLEDTWGRPVFVLDEQTTAGITVLTASGPLGDFDLEGQANSLSILYRNCLDLVSDRATAISEGRGYV